MKKQILTLPTFLLSLFVIGIIFFLFIYPFLPASYSLANDEEVKKGLKTLQSVQAVMNEEEISTKLANASYQIELNQRKEQGQPIDHKFLFRRSALIGDSMSSGLVDYRLLDPTNVFAKRGKRINNSDEEVDAAIAFHPDHVFIQFGMNDLIYYRGDSKPFIEAYEEVVNKIKQALPKAHIYVIGIQPIQEKAFANSPSLKNYSEYNQAMKDLCQRLKLTFVDTSILINESSPYEFDGIHPQEPYFSNWVNLMVMMLEKKEAGN